MVNLPFFLQTLQKCRLKACFKYHPIRNVIVAGAKCRLRFYENISFPFHRRKILTCFRQIVLKMNFFSESICELLKGGLLLLHFPRIKPAARMTLQCDALFRFEAQIRFYQKVFSDNTSLFL